MPELHAFRGLRYDLGHVGALSDVVAPPYDVIDPELQSALYERHPANVIRLILNRDEPGDEDDDARYARAARFLKNWVREGLLAVPSPIRRSTSITSRSNMAAPNSPAADSWGACGWSGSAKGRSIRTKRPTPRPRRTA